MMQAHPLDTLFRNGLKSLEQSRLEEFLLIESEKAISKAERRVLVHLQVKGLFNQGRYHESIELIRQCFSENGEHLGLWCDLATAYYLSGQYGLWATTLLQIEDVILPLQDSVSSESLLRTQTMSAKFFEETGDLHKAVQYSKQTLEKSRDPVWILRSKVNMVRLLAMYPLSAELSYYYRDLRTALSGEHSAHLEVELLHAVILAEVSLFGAKMWAQAQTLLSQYQIPQEDLALLVFDVFELALRQGQELPAELKAWLSKVNPQCLYEEIIMEIVQEQELSRDWIEVAARLPQGQYLRLATLVLQRQRLSGEGAMTLVRQLELTLMGYNGKDQKVWMSFYAQQVDKSEILMSWQDDSKLVINDNVHINLSSKKMILKLLRQLEAQPQMAFTDLTEKIYGVEYNESYFHRLRRLVKRFNDDVLALGAPALLEIKDGQVHLLAQISKKSLQ